MKKTYLLLLCLSILIIPINGQSTEIPDFVINDTVTVMLEDNGSFERIIPYMGSDLQIIVRQSSGNGTLQFYFFSDETYDSFEIPENASLLFDLNGTQYFRLPTNESIVYREIPAKDGRTDTFIASRDRKLIYGAELFPDWKMVVRYNGNGLAKFNLTVISANQKNIVYYQELSLNDTVPTILDYVGLRQHMNLTVGYLEGASPTTNLTIVWTTKNVSSTDAPEDFMNNPFAYDSESIYRSGPRRVGTAYNDSSGISLVKSVNLSLGAHITVYLDHPYFLRYVEYNWTTPYEQTPFHLAFYADEPIVIWFRLTTWLGDGFDYPRYAVSSMPSTSSSTEQEQSPIFIGGLALGLVVSAVILTTKSGKKKWFDI